MKQLRGPADSVRTKAQKRRCLAEEAMVDMETARARAEECRKIARYVASTPIAKENWERLAQQWETARDGCREQCQGQNTSGEVTSANYDQPKREF